MDASKKAPGARKGGYLLALFLLPIILCFSYYYFVVRKPLVAGDESIYVKLPYYGPKKLAPNGKDTIYHLVPEFSFVNQNGKVITDKDMEGKICVVDFFSTSCQTVCPKLSAQFFNIQKKLGFIKNFALISFSVEPEKDSVSVLKYYSGEVHADDQRWNLLTGERSKLYELATTGYYIYSVDTTQATGELNHSKTLALIDRDRHIRGYYDGTTVTDVNRLEDEVRVLYAEYKMKDRKKKATVN